MIIQCIKKCLHNIPPHDSVLSVNASALTTHSEILPYLNTISLRHCHRLDKHSDNSPQPRPLLVTLNKANEVSYILAQEKHCHPGEYIIH